jgi:hypothetical protein
MRGRDGAAAVALIAVTACSTRGQSAASCVGPQLSATPSSAKAGARVHVSGEFFAANCPDTVVNGHTEKWIPLTGLQLDVLQDQQTWTVAKGVNASGSHESFAVDVALPADLRPGPAAIHVPGYGMPVTLTIAR